MPKFLVIGQIFLSDGFDIEIEAETKQQAEALAIAEITDTYLVRPDMTCEIQEVCVNSTEELTDDT